jgi:RNA polymerase sigma-70 factor (ECF subfamily)
MESDERLCERIDDGELDAFDRLYERYERRLYGFILGYLGDPQEAEDVLSEAFLALVRRRPEPRSSFRGWLFQTARNGCLNRLRSRVRAARALSRVADSPLAPPPSADEALVERDVGRALSTAVARLPLTLSEVYRLRVSGMSYEEMAQVLEVPLGTVKSRLHEMVNRLKEEMRPWTAK